MRERAPAFRSADHNADSACKPRLRAPADQAGAGEVAARDHSWQSRFRQQMAIPGATACGWTRRQRPKPTS